MFIFNLRTKNVIGTFSFTSFQTWLLLFPSKYPVPTDFHIISEHKCIDRQEYIPVRCVPSAAVAVSPAMHAPPPAPLSCTPPVNRMTDIQV